MYEIRHFQPTQRAFVKQLLVLFWIKLVLVPTVYAEDDKWINGIKFRYGESANRTEFYMGEDQIFRTAYKYANMQKEEGGRMFPFALALPETLMNSYSFRGGQLEFRPKTEVRDLAPADVDIEGRKSGDEVILLQLDAERTALYNDFYNTTD